MGRRKIELARHDVAESKQAAIEAGLPAYHGAPCSQGHTRRWTSNGMCVECSRSINEARADARAAEREERANLGLTRLEWRARADGLEAGRAYVIATDNGGYVRSAHVQPLYLQHEACEQCGSRVRYTASEACEQCGKPDELARRRAQRRAKQQRYRARKAGGKSKADHVLKPTRADLLDL